MIRTELSSDGRTLTMGIVGKFDFSIQQQFREAYENESLDPSLYVVDLQKADYMDSAALGILLLLREYGGDGKIPVAIINIKPQIRKILDIAGFGEMFNIK